MLMDDEELRAWMRVAHTPAIGRRTVRSLLAALGSPQAVAQARPAQLAPYLTPAEQQAWVQGEAIAQAAAELALAWLAGSRPDEPRQVLSLADAAYPSAWLESADPPTLVYVLGQVEALQRPALAMVGTRHPTPQGREDAQAFARAFSQAGWVVVSGLALGIDACAHAGALQGPGGTVAVVGTGLDRVYPAAHRALAHRIVTAGALVSELPLGSPPLPAHFPSRNRLIATMTRGTLVVEAAVRSGSLITARLAAEAGREVFAMPGSIHAPQARGCHWLIKQGAKLVETAEDVLQELGAGPVRLGATGAREARAPALRPGPATTSAGATTTPPERPAPQPTEGGSGEGAALSPAQQSVLQALGHEPTGLDRLLARTGWDVARLQALLLELELAGRVVRCPDGRWQQIRRA